MSNKHENHVCFTSQYWLNEPADTPHGRALAIHVHSELQAMKYAQTQIQNREDFCWEWMCSVRKANVIVQVGHFDTQAGGWLIAILPRIRPIERIFGVQRVDENASVCSSVDSVLRADRHISNIRWYTERDFNSMVPVQRTEHSFAER